MDDRVVPPPQAESMFEAAKGLGVPTFIIEYDGEGCYFNVILSYSHRHTMTTNS